MYVPHSTAEALHAFTLDLEETTKKHAVAVAWLARQVQTRDRKQAQIPLTDHEARYWQKRIDDAQAVVDQLAARLAALMR